MTAWTAACQAPLSSTVSQNLLRFTFIELVMLSNHLILCFPLLLLLSIFPSIRVLSNESVLRITWPKYWSFSFSNSLPNEYLGLISFRIDKFDLLEVRGTLRTLLQHHLPNPVQVSRKGPQAKCLHLGGRRVFPEMVTASGYQ